MSSVLVLKPKKQQRLGQCLIQCIVLNKKTIVGSFSVSAKLPTYPSPKPTLTLTSPLGQNVGLREG